MHCFVIDVRGICSSGTIWLPGMLLLISDEMFCARNNTRALDPLDRFGHSHTSENWVRTESFPIATSFWSSADWTYDVLASFRQRGLEFIHLQQGRVVHLSLCHDVLLPLPHHEPSLERYSMLQLRSFQTERRNCNRLYYFN